MKLVYKVAIRLSVAMIPLLALWTVIFYFIMVEEINDETDDALDGYSEQIIARKNSGEQMPQTDDGINYSSNNSYSLLEVSEVYASVHSRREYYDTQVYIYARHEYEPARVLTTIFKASDDCWYELKVLTPTFEKEDLLRTVLIFVLLLYIVILVTGMTVTMFIFQKSMKPLYTLLHWIDRYVPGKNITAELTKTDISEFVKLHHTIEKAAERLDGIYDRQKQFIGNASHELQTPLAVLGNKMEWMLNNSDLNEEQMEQLVGMLQTQRQAVRLNKDLLLLTKIDNMQFADREDVDIVEIITDSVEMYNDIYESKSIECKCIIPREFVLNMNKSLASVLVTNLIRNAYIHSVNGAFLMIELSNNALTVSNTGKSPLDSSKIFQRFYQGQKKEGSTGLGLSIVKAICDTYNMQVNYKFESNRHIFSVKF